MLIFPSSFSYHAFIFMLLSMSPMLVCQWIGCTLCTLCHVVMIWLSDYGLFIWMLICYNKHHHAMLKLSFMLSHQCDPNNHACNYSHDLIDVIYINHLGYFWSYVSTIELLLCFHCSSQALMNEDSLLRMTAINKSQTCTWLDRYYVLTLLVYSTYTCHPL